MCSSDIFLSVVAILFPPFPVWVKRGICSADSIINILLLILGYIPGLIHAWYIIFKHPEPPYDYDYTQGAHSAEHGRNSAHNNQQGRVYVFVHDGAGRAPLNQNPAHYSAQPKIQGNMNYGSTNNHAVSSSNHAGQEEGIAGPSDGGAPPPSYAQVVASGAPGDHKIQTQE
ncbi:hypothetical protein QBC43DRAFT_37264 [Cladorrhinum sp. PSN259]|nr:hypothetical protein QBC43DRAFT_37264 [Cladorrhinum sp. PSN259]